jgi:DHHC palmitoyltransferase
MHKVVVAATASVAASTIAIAVLVLGALRNDPSIVEEVRESTRRHRDQFLVLLTLYSICYIRTCFTPPGGAADWERARPDTLFAGDATTDDEPQQSPCEWRFCGPCDAPKPPRVSHCRACKSCILRYDHHCIWLSCCIGLNNHKVFLPFLLYGLLCCGHAVYILATFLYHVHTFRRFTQRRFPAAFICSLIAPLCILAATAVGCLLLAMLRGQASLVLRNETPVELAQRPAALLARRAAEPLAPTRAHPCLWLTPVREDRRGPAARRVAEAQRRRCVNV